MQKNQYLKMVIEAGFKYQSIPIDSYVKCPPLY